MLLRRRSRKSVVSGFFGANSMDGTADPFLKAASFSVKEHFEIGFAQVA